jgi:phospholipase/carboxylesterase
VGIRTALTVILVAAGSLAACGGPSPLATITAGGAGPPTLVLLHGYGSSAEQWAPFTRTIRLPANGRFVFPQGPGVTSIPDGPAAGRAWWRLGLASHIPPGGTLPDLSSTRPPELHDVASRVGGLIETVARGAGRPIFLGGYSQGAMVASELAFRTDTRVDALILLSGTLVDEASWEREFAKRRELPVFMSHGRSDPVLPFDIADRFRSKLQAAGLRVTWVPFDGGHEIPSVVVQRLNDFLAKLPGVQ